MATHSDTNSKMFNKPFLGSQNSLRVLYNHSKTPGSVKKTSRHIPQVPERILDAPDILDDYCKLLILIYFHFKILLVRL